MLALAPSLLRALGEGVARLNDGDPKDREHADNTVKYMALMGYVHSGYNFVSFEQILVTGHMHPGGFWTNDLNDTEKTRVVASLGALTADLVDLIHACKFDDLPELVLSQMATTIRDLRSGKGLRYEPADLRKSE
jgi:hypothetical protein